jgi:D-lactate dehydrogenase (cytochrome)
MDAKYLSDAAHFPGGHAVRVEVPRTIDEIPDILRGAPTLLPIGAQSSLTGGATPMGEVVLSTEKLTRILEIGDHHIRVEAGVPIVTMQQALGARGGWFPPAPTYLGAFAGGIVATNAAGAATFKYGSVRGWVDALTLVLADGTPLGVRRGESRARLGHLSVSGIDVPVPTYPMPDVVKRSAGYHAEPDMDVIDLFIGSEGTLGVITTVTFRVVMPAPTIALAFVPCSSDAQALALVRDLRDASSATWRAGDPDGIDVAAIEHMDRRCLEILQEDGADRKYEVTIPPDADVALLVQLELAPGTTGATAVDQIERSLTDRGSNSALARFCRLLDAHAVLDRTEMALPGQARRADALIGLREAVPAGVNQRVGARQRDVDPRIAKTAADMIVPFERFGEMLQIYRSGFATRGLDAAIWGHISDGNVHPNVLPRSYEDVERGKDAIFEFGRAVARLGGCPLAEHGVGRNPVKQGLLRTLYGDEGIEQMRRVKRALDPAWKLAPGVIFSR